jgi:hypothetical protein
MAEKLIEVMRCMLFYLSHFQSFYYWFVLHYSQELDDRYKKTCERLKDKPEFKSDFLDALYNQITRGDFEVRRR